ncbi:MAG: ornithine cyclodeaminase family protein [Gammaproteobacteria bacterium]|nr:ornithine cyclodeaminase family protein [Gammaproteobacteria bacterium]MBU2285544.1 ornithine cyclodeaminase family protein [Gammaproteobacteria bacterium]
MKIYDADLIAARLPFDALVPALRAAFAGDTQVPPRHVHAVGAGADRGTVLIMPAWGEHGFMGIKTINIFPGNGARGLPGLHASYMLYDAHTGVPLAHMDGNEITARRTAAASALGASLLAREDASTLLVVGAGRIAHLLPAAHASVRKLRRIEVWNHRPEGARALAEAWQQAGWDAHATVDLEHAVRSADIVSCATLATRPLVHGDWLQPGSHLDLIGSFTPDTREADPACFAGARVFVDTDEALAKSGDLLDAVAAGTLRADAVQATLAQLCRGERTGRRSPDERTVFKAVGSALEDLAAAMQVWRADGPATPG